MGLHPLSFPTAELGPDATAAERDAAAAWSAIAQLFIAQQSVRDDIARSLGLNVPEVISLFHLHPDQGTIQRDLAEHWACDPSWVTNRVDRLEELGLAERRTSATDRRAKEVWLTPAGVAAQAEARAAFARPPAALAQLPEADLRVLAEVLGRLVAD